MAGRMPDFRWRRQSRRRIRANELTLSIAGSQRKQSLLNEDGHLAGVADGLAPLLENARIPIDAVGQLVALALVLTGRILELAQLGNLEADPVRERRLLAREPLEAVHHLAAFLIERGEQSREKQLCLFARVGSIARNEV